MEVNPDYWNDKRQRIYQWMVGNGQESFAELYKGCAVTLHLKPPGHVRFICHGVREIMNRMPAHKLGVESKRVEYKQMADKLSKLWNDHGLLKKIDLLNPSATKDMPPSGLNIPFSVAAQIQKLIYEHEGGSRRSGDSPFLFFQAYLPKENRTTLPKAYPALWKELHGWFMKYCHENGKLPDGEVAEQIEEKFAQLEDILLSVADRFANTIRTVDEILDETNT